MSFIVVERDPADGAIRVMLPHEFTERGAALEALSVAVSAGEVSVRGEVLIADLATAVPVLIMPTTATPEPAAGVWEAPVEPPGAESGAGADSDAEAADAIFGDIASALRRAATSLESEGVVAPDSISSEEPSAPDEGVPDADDERSERAEEPVTSVELPVEAIVEEPFSVESEIEAPGSAEEIVAEPVGEEWPWANVESYASAAEESSDIDEAAAGAYAEQVDTAVPAVLEDEESPFLQQVAEPASVGFDALPAGEPLPASDPLEEPAVEESSLIIPTAVDGDDAFMPKPVILGDYEDAVPDLDAQIASLSADEAVLEEAPDLDAQIAELGADEADVDEESPETVVPEDAVGESAIAEIAEQEAEEIVSDGAPETVVPEGVLIDTDMSEIAEPEAEVLEYVVGTELDLGEYTCDDCIYVNTCPKVGQSTPAECGSFQWKSD